MVIGHRDNSGNVQTTIEDQTARWPKIHKQFEQRCNNGASSSMSHTSALASR